MDSQMKKYFEINQLDRIKIMYLIIFIMSVLIKTELSFTLSIVSLIGYIFFLVIKRRKEKELENGT